jgi:hypothetical protein
VIVNSFKRVRVATAGSGTEVFQWSEFRYEIGGRDILFRVTSSTTKPFAFVLTHGASGRRVDEVSWRDVVSTRYNAGRNNYGAAGAKALTRKIEQVGIKRFIAATHGYQNG